MEVGKLADLHSSKKDIPTMGGVLIYLAIVFSVLIWATLNPYVVTALVSYTGLSIIRFLDDYLNITKKNSKGLNSKWKLAGQGLITVIAVTILFGAPGKHLEMSELWVPFYKHPLIQEMPIWLMFFFFFFVMAGSSNALNLTDGVDGLAIGCTIPVVLIYGLMAYVTDNTIIAKYLFVNSVPGCGELAIVCSSVMGAAMVFLWYNSHPAEVFMGDTGSLGLGGLISSIAFMVHEPFTLIIVGGVFVIEAASVILQIFSFKLLGRKIFKMSPIHHHFELMGWHESKVVIRFWIISLSCALVGLTTLKLR